jgi:hypothetical protein
MLNVHTNNNQPNLMRSRKKESKLCFNLRFPSDSWTCVGYFIVPTLNVKKCPYFKNHVITLNVRRQLMMFS